MKRECGVCGVTRSSIYGLHKPRRMGHRSCWPPHPPQWVCNWHLEATPDDYETDYEQLKRRLLEND